jgi:hypothetical protein
MFVRRFRDARSKDLETLPSPLAFAKTARRRHHDPYSQRNLCASGVVLGVESSVRGGPAVTSENAKFAKLARAGETAAYESLVRNHQAAAFRTAYLIPGDASEAEDAAQEAFVKAYRAWGVSRPVPPSGDGCSPWSQTKPRTAAKLPSGAPTSPCERGWRALGERPTLPRGDYSGRRAASRVAPCPRRSARGGSAGDRLQIFPRALRGRDAATLGCARGTVKSPLSRAISGLRKRIEEATDAR